MRNDSRHFRDDLDRLKHRLLEMAALVDTLLRRSVSALVERSHEVLAEIESQDTGVDALQVEIDDRCFKLIALQQPVAIDLRAIVSAMKINSDLEQVKELAVNVARAAQSYISHPPVKPLIDLPRMTELALEMLRDAINAFVARDIDLAQQVLQQDDLLDALKDQVFREVITHMLGDPSKIEAGIALVFISRHLERVGDHATNIAEDVIFIVEGRDIRHRTALQTIERRGRSATAPM